MYTITFFSGRVSKSITVQNSVQAYNYALRRAYDICGDDAELFAFSKEKVKSAIQRLVAEKAEYPTVTIYGCTIQPWADITVQRRCMGFDKDKVFMPEMVEVPYFSEISA